MNLTLLSYFIKALSALGYLLKPEDMKFNPPPIYCDNRLPASSGSFIINT